MKKSWILLTACAALLSGVEAIACTGLLVGKKASTDGSVMISYAADSHSLYGEMYRWPAATWPKGAMLEVKEWDTGKPLGKIAQVEKTYSVVGNMNEHQVAITESTFGGRHELANPTAWATSRSASPTSNPVRPIRSACGTCGSSPKGR